MVCKGARASEILQAKWRDFVDNTRLKKHVSAYGAFFCIDNVVGVLNSSFLCQLIERPYLEVRPLGRSEMITITQKPAIFTTGNNIIVSGDLVRRSLLCRLDAKTENPENRKFTQKPFDLVIKNREKYVAACLTIVKAYIQAGFPNKPTPLASFESWSDYVRGALLWLNLADPVVSIQTMKQEDVRRNELEAVIEAWAQTGDCSPKTVKELIALATQHTPLRDALLDVAGEKGEIKPKRLGYWLRSNKDRVASGFRIEKYSFVHDHIARWKLIKVNQTTTNDPFDCLSNLFESE